MSTSLRLYSRAWLLACLIVCLGGGLQAETRHIHILKMLDNENHDFIIREGCRSIEFGVGQEVQLLKHELGIDQVLEYNISGPNFKLDHLDQVLNYDMEYQERDIVILVYVGHGFRDAAMPGSMPTLYFNSYTQSIALAELQERILDKKPSLLLTIAVACNASVENWGIPPPYLPVNDVPEVVGLPGGGRRTDTYRALFGAEENYTKCIDLISADQEFYTFISADGGIFFTEVMYTLQEALSGQVYPDWDNICRAITSRTTERSARKGLQQQPYCRYFLRINSVEVRGQSEPGDRRPSACEQAARSLRQGQRQELRQLRREHRQAAQLARQRQVPKPDRQLLARQQSVELEQVKLRHQKDYVRHLQQCH